jgi:exosortase
MKTLNAEKIHLEPQSRVTPRNISFLLFNIIALMMFYRPIHELFSMSLHNNLYSHVVLVPLVSGYLIYSRRKIIFEDVRCSFLAVAVIFAGICLYLIWKKSPGSVNQNDAYSLISLSFVIFWIGGFIFLYGIRAFRRALFPLLFLFFMAPIPTLMADKIIWVLESGSTEVSYWLFELSGVPFAREGFVFHLPGLSIEVAEQCSGIRSSLVLLMFGILLGNLFLKSRSGRLLLILAVFPVTVLKNALRIVMLSVLGAYVDIRILDGILHRRGGVPFFVIALSMLVIFLWALRLSEKSFNARGETKCLK